MLNLYFSATLTPIDYFKEALGGDSGDFCVYAPSPFEPENLFVAVDASISTKYKDRPACYGKIAEAVFSFISAREGNYFVFFSSYEFLINLAKIFTGRYPHINTHLQSKDMNSAERESFLQKFSPGNTGCTAGFLVMGGALSGMSRTGGRCSLSIPAF